MQRRANTKVKQVNLCILNPFIHGPSVRFSSNVTQESWCLNKKYLSWGLHIDHVCTSSARMIGILERLQQKLHPAVIHHIYTTAIRQKFEYASSIWSGGNTTKLTKLEESFSRCIGISLTKLENRFAYRTLILFFKIKLESAPLYLRSLLPTLSSSNSGYNFRRVSYPAVQRSAMLQSEGGAVANRLRRRTSDQMVLGSNPAVAAALSPWTRLFTPIVPRRSLHISFY